jgi:hypothetical protein
MPHGFYFSIMKNTQANSGEPEWNLWNNKRREKGSRNNSHADCIFDSGVDAMHKHGVAFPYA